MSLALRIFTLALLLGWQAVASGVGLAHFCPKQAATTTACHCPHGEKKAEKASHDDGMTLRKDCCDALERQMPAPAVVDVSSHGAPLTVPAAPPPMWLTFETPEGGGRLSLALWDTPHAQGPPAFLRIRSLLI